MVEKSSSVGSASGRRIDVTPRTFAAIVISVLVVLFIALNRDETKISFIVFSHRTSLWIALTAAAAGGFLAGFLVSRRRYRR